MADLTVHYRKNVLRVLGQNAWLGLKGGALQAAQRIAPGSKLTGRLGVSTLGTVDNIIFGNIRRASAGKLPYDAELRRQWLDNVRQSRRQAMQLGRSTDEHDEMLRLLADMI